MEKEFVTVKGKKYYVEDGALDLSGLKINKITEIKILTELINLKALYLGENFIKEIQGLEGLTNLRELDLSHNHIKEIKGLENLRNLENLFLYDNPIREDEFHLLKKEAHEVVRYCQEKASKAKK